MSHLKWVHEGPYARFQKRISGLPTEDQTPYGQTRSYGRRQENPLQGGMSPRRVRFRYREKTGLAIEMLNAHHLELAGREEAAERQRNYNFVHRKGRRELDEPKLAGSEARAHTARARGEYRRAAIGDDGNESEEHDGHAGGTVDASVGGDKEAAQSSSRAEPLVRPTSSSSALSASRAGGGASAAAAPAGPARSRIQSRPTSPPGGRLEPVSVALTAVRGEDGGGGGGGAAGGGGSSGASAREREPRDTETTRAYAKAVLSGDKFVVERASRAKAHTEGLTELAERRARVTAAGDGSTNTTEQQQQQADDDDADDAAAAGGHRNRFDVLLDEPRGTDDVETLLRLCKSSSDPAQVRQLGKDIRAGEVRRLAEQQEALPRHLRRPLPEFPAGGVLNARCATGYPPLVIAAARDDYNSVPVLVAAGALPDVRACDTNNAPPPAPRVPRVAWRGSMRSKDGTPPRVFFTTFAELSPPRTDGLDDGV